METHHNKLPYFSPHPVKPTLMTCSSFCAVRIAAARPIFPPYRVPNFSSLGPTLMTRGAPKHLCTQKKRTLTAKLSAGEVSMRCNDPPRPSCSATLRRLEIRRRCTELENPLSAAASKVGRLHIKQGASKKHFSGVGPQPSAAPACTCLAHRFSAPETVKNTAKIPLLHPAWARRR